MKRTLFVAIATLLLASSAAAQYPGFPTHCFSTDANDVVFCTVEPFNVDAYSNEVVANVAYHITIGQRWLLPTNDQTRRAIVVYVRGASDPLPRADRDGYIAEFYPTHLTGPGTTDADRRYDVLTGDQRASAFKLDVPPGSVTGPGVLLVYRTFNSCGAAAVPPLGDRTPATRAATGGR